MTMLRLGLSIWQAAAKFSSSPPPTSDPNQETAMDGATLLTLMDGSTALDIMS